MCTRAVYIGLDSNIITARSMDWSADLASNLWSFPRGMSRDGAAGSTTIRWTSKYGSVVASAFESFTVDGINEKGLVANLLYLVESEYVQPLPGDLRLPISVSAWTQYVLDNYATVAEAVNALMQEPFYVIPVPIPPNGTEGRLHLSISDAQGDSAIFEYISGKLVIHHGQQFNVMTNSPIFEQQLTLDAYWQQIGGLTMLPGTNRPVDRYVRASFYVNAMTKTADNLEAVAGAFSVIRNASVPLGLSMPEQPEIDETLWRTVIDHKNLRYYFDSARSPNVIWVDLQDFIFALDNQVKKLTLTNDGSLVGNVSAKFVPAEPFKFLQASVD